jgi:hypothetical protein
MIYRIAQTGYLNAKLYLEEIYESEVQEGGVIRAKTLDEI